MADIQTILNREFTTTALDIKRNIDRKDVSASGNLSRSLRILSRRNSAKLFAASYYDYVEYGVGPTGNFKAYPFVYEWLQYQKYGLRWQTESERRSLAYLITRKRAELGSYQYRQGRPADIAITPIESAKQRIRQAMTDEYKANFTDTIRKALAA